MLFFVAIVYELISVGFSQNSHATPEQSMRIVKSYYPAAPLHYVKIGKKLDGDYKFGYDTGKGPLGQSFREEIRLADGTITGTYGLIDEQGQKRVVRYSAGKSGFIAHEDKYSNATWKPTIKMPSPQSRKTINMKTLTPNYQQLNIQTASFRPSGYLASKSTPALNRLSTTMKSSILQNPITQPLKISSHRDKSTSTLIVNNITRSNDSLKQSIVETYKLPKSIETSRHYFLKNNAVPNLVSNVNSTSSSEESSKPQMSVHQDEMSYSAKNAYKVSMKSDRDKYIESSIESYGPTFDVYGSKPGDLKDRRFPFLSLEQLTPLSINPYKPFRNEQYHTFSAKSDESSFRQSNEKDVVNAPLQGFPPFNRQNSKLSLEDEYYDITPVFVDEERLSYNIGTGSISSEY